MDERNLTKERRLAFLLPEAAHIAGHEVVLVDPDGKEPPRLLGAGRRFQRGWLGRQAAVVAYAVPSARQLRHDFSRPWETVDQWHSATLRYRLHFRISSPVLLVERLASDPLRQLEDEVDAVVAARVRQLDWEIVEDGSLLEEHALSGGTSSEELRDFAADLGFELTRVEISRTLPETEVAVQSGAAARKKAERELEHEKELHQLGLEHEKALRADELQLTREQASEARSSLGDARQIAAAQVELRKTMIAASGEGIRQAVERAVRGIERPEDLRKVAEAVVDAARVLNVGDPSTERRRLAPPRARPALGESESDLWEDALAAFAQMRRHFLSLPCDENESRQLLSAALHLIAEATLGGDADEEALAAYRETLEDGHRRNAMMDRPLNDLFKRLIDVDGLRRDLSW